MKHWHHSAEAKAKIGAASRARGSAAKALDARWAATRAAKALMPPKTRRIVRTPEERRAINVIRAKKWAAKNRERSKEIKRRWYERHRQEINAKQRAKNKTPERKAFMRAYSPKHRAENPDMYLTYSQNRRSAQLNAPGSHTDEQWASLVEAHQGRCAYCDAEGRMTRDHDIPLVRGGSNDISNIVPACGSCNSAKGTLTGEEYRKRLSGEGVSMDERWRNQLRVAQECGRANRWA